MFKKLVKPLTRQGFMKLAEEHENLLKVERPKIVEGVATAAAEGDRSENAEYIYGKKRLREIDKRLRYLTHLLKDVQIVDPENLYGDEVCFGSTVVVQDEQGKVNEWTIVGEGEADSRLGSISWKSPVGRALLGKKVGQFVYVERPIGDMEFEILELKFAGISWRDKKPPG